MEPHLGKRRGGGCGGSCPRETAEPLIEIKSQSVKQSAAPKSRQPFKSARQLGWPERSGAEEAASIHLPPERGWGWGCPRLPPPVLPRSSPGGDTPPPCPHRRSLNRRTVPGATARSCSGFPSRDKIAILWEGGRPRAIRQDVFATFSHL